MEWPERNGLVRRSVSARHVEHNLVVPPQLLEKCSSTLPGLTAADVIDDVLDATSAVDGIEQPFFELTNDKNEIAVAVITVQQHGGRALRDPLLNTHGIRKAQRDIVPPGFTVESNSRAGFTGIAAMDHKAVAIDR